MSFLDDLYREHGDSVQQQVSQQLGIPPEQAARVLPQVAPIILGGLKRRMDEHGAESVEQQVSAMGSHLNPDDISAMLRHGAESRADSGLDGILGDKGHQASSLMANQLGISQGAAAKLIPMLAPLIIGMLMKKGGGQQAGGGGGLGGIASILDRNGDGSILDDLAGLIGGGGGLGQILGGAGASGATGPAAGKSGCLGALLGSLLGGGKR